MGSAYHEMWDRVRAEKRKTASRIANKCIKKQNIFMDEAIANLIMSEEDKADI